MTEIYIFQNQENDMCRVQVVGLFQHIRNRDSNKFEAIAVIKVPNQEFKRKHYFDIYCKDPVKNLIKKQGAEELPAL